MRGRRQPVVSDDECCVALIAVLDFDGALLQTARSTRATSNICVRYAPRLLIPMQSFLGCGDEKLRQPVRSRVLVPDAASMSAATELHS